MSGDEPFHLKRKGAKWWHSDDYASPSLRPSSLGEFFFHVLSAGAHIGTVWPFNAKFRGSVVIVTVYMTDAQREHIESATRYRFRPPPKITLNSSSSRTGLATSPATTPAAGREPVPGKPDGVQTPNPASSGANSHGAL